MELILQSLDIIFSENVNIISYCDIIHLTLSIQFALLKQLTMKYTVIQVFNLGAGFLSFNIIINDQ